METVLRGTRRALGRLTNARRCYSLGLPENDKANCAKCWRTSHSSDPTLHAPVNGLHSIITNRGTPVLRGCGGPTDLHVGLGRFGVPVGEGV